MIDSQYIIGQEISFTFAEQDSDGNSLLPSTLALRILDPRGVQVAVNYPDDISLLPDGSYDTPFDMSAFEYIFDTTNRQPGRYYYQWLSTGFGQSVKQGIFYLLRSKFSALRPLQLRSNISASESIHSQLIIA